MSLGEPPISLPVAIANVIARAAGVRIRALPGTAKHLVQAPDGVAQ